MKHRLAWFTPLDKISAIGKVSVSICRQLNKNFDVDIWAPAGFDNVADIGLNVVEFDGSAGAADLDKYDYVVYNMGNFAGYHRNIYDMMRKKTGVVILHDRTYCNFFGQYYLLSEFGGDPAKTDDYADFIASCYGKIGLAEFEKACDAGIFPFYEQAAIPSFPFLRPVIENAEAVFTHSSRFVREVKNMSCGPVGFSYLPCDVYGKSGVAGKEPIYDLIPEDKNKPLIVSTGMVHSLKRIDKVVEVLLQNKSIASKVRYVVIGSYGGDYGMKLEKYSKNELSGCLYMLGYQNDDIMKSALREADLCFNLRYPNSEVCSLSLLEQMSFGNPVVVIDSGVYGEMPDDAVIKVVLSNEKKSIEKILKNFVSDLSTFRETGRKAEKFIETRCSAENYAAVFSSFLKSLKKDDEEFYRRMVDETIDHLGLELERAGVVEWKLPHISAVFVNRVCRVFGERPAEKTDGPKTIALWFAFQYNVPTLKRKRITRCMVIIVGALMRRYGLSCEVWCYSVNDKEIRESFESIISDPELGKNIKVIHENCWADALEVPEIAARREYSVNIDEDNLYEIARDFSRADCFIPATVYLDQVINIGRPVAVPLYDMFVSSKYYEFIKLDKLYKSRALDCLARAENLARNGARAFTLTETARREQILKYVKNFGEERVKAIYVPVAIPSGVEDKIPSEKDLRERFGLSGDYFFYPAQIRPYKNVSLLIKAMNLLKKRSTKAVLVLTGNPEDLPETAELIKRYHLQDRIKLTGDLTDAELYGFYKYAAAVPVPTLTEVGFPLQAIEGFYMGAPVFISNIPVVTERIESLGFDEDSCGSFIFNPHDEEKLASFMLAALENGDAIREEQKAFRTALLSYTEKEAAEIYYNFIFGRDDL